MVDIACAIEKYRELILEAERYIWQNPETGYKEHVTSKYLAEKFEALVANGGLLACLELVGIRGMRQRLDEQRAVAEAISQALFQFFQIVRLHNVSFNGFLKRLLHSLRSSLRTFPPSHGRSGRKVLYRQSPRLDEWHS